MTAFRSITPDQLNCQPTHMIGQQWFLLTAGSSDSFNTMTCAWGGIGFLWNRPVTFTFVRPQRYTFEFTEKHPLFTMSFFPQGQRDALTYCGTHSGRDVDKIKETGLTPVFDADDTIYFKQAELVIKCSKIYQTDICESSMLQPNIIDLYPDHDFHRMYIGQIHDILKKV